MPTIEELQKEIQKLQKELTRYKKQLKDKRYGLVWLDVPEAFEEESENQMPVLEEVKELAIKNDDGKPTHILIEGDNYHALTCLNYTHKGKIDLIYIDPPYNTGSDGFRYKDKRVLDKFPDGSDVPKNHPLRHSYWLSFMSKRLELAFNLLSKEGFLVASIDDNEIANLKHLLDKFTNDNTKIISVKMSEASGLKMGATNKVGNIPKYKEFIVYAKPKGINNLFFDKVTKSKWDEEYNIYWDNFSKEDKEIINEISSLESYSNVDIEVVDNILSKVEIVNVASKIKELKIEEKKREEWLFENSWRITRTAASTSVKRLVDEKKKKIKQQIFSVISVRDSLLYLVRSDYSDNSKNPRVQFLFAEDNLKTHPGDFWYDIKSTGLEAEGGVEFKNGKKPLALIERIIKSQKEKNAVVLDFFAGSGTTLEALINTNNNDKGSRQAILVTNNEANIAKEVCYRRIQNIKNGYSIKEKSNFGLKYYKTTFVGKHNIKGVTDEDKAALALKCGYLLAITENTLDEIEHTKFQQHFTNGKRNTAIYFQENLTEYQNFFAKVESSYLPTTVYLFSWDTENEFENDYLHLRNVTVKSIPQPIVKIYKSIFNLDNNDITDGI